MKSEFHEKTLVYLNFQRNIFIALTFLLVISQVILSIFLFWKNERIIIVPPVIEKEFWVEANTISATYLEQFGYFLGKLVLEKSPQSAQTQRTIVLRHVDPAYYGILNKKLIEEEQKLSKQGASYVFYPIDVQADPKGLKVLITGDRIFYIAGKPISTERESYILSFSSAGSRLLLKEIAARDNKNE